MSYPIPTHPWQLVASDCFEINGRHYVVLVDIYSDFIELSQLPDLSSNALIKAIKPVFATHGAPATLITDNGTNFISSEFHRFLKSWDVNHITSSPHHHQSNGRAEAAVKLMKEIIKKTTKEGTDMWKAILEWCNATTPGMRSSPAQRLLSRRTHSMLPCKAPDYTPQVQMDIQLALIKKRQTTKSYYDRHAKQLPDLAIGQPIRVKCHPQSPNSDWTPGIITSKAAPRSYMVQVDGRQYRRNRIHLRQQATFPDRASTELLNIHPRQLDTLPDQTPADPQNTPIQICTSQTHKIQPRRSSRPVQVPARLKDHDLSKGRRTKQKN